MKKYLFTTLICFIAITCGAQGIYRTVIKYDKFDDVVWKREVKTLITKTDTSFIIETKGKKPEEYLYSETPLRVMHVGSRDSLVNLVQDVWGYENQYKVLTPKDKKELLDYGLDQVKGLPDSLVFEEKILMFAGLKMLGNFDKYPTISIRTVSRYKYSFEYQTDLFWIKFNDGTRIIYER